MSLLSPPVRLDSAKNKQKAIGNIINKSKLAVFSKNSQTPHVMTAIIVGIGDSLA